MSGRPPVVRAFLQCCQGISSTSRDWNAEFQSLVERQEYSAASSREKWDLIHELVEEFEETATRLCLRLIEVDDEEADDTDVSRYNSGSVHSHAVLSSHPETKHRSGSGIPELHGFPQVYRVGNIMLYAWTEARPPRQLQAGLKAILQSNQVDISVPLTTCIVFQGIPITAHALVPLSDSSPVAFGSGAQLKPSPMMECAVRQIGDTIGVAMSYLSNHLEVVSGEDGRSYVIFPGHLTPALPNTGPVVGAPRHRIEDLVRTKPLVDPVSGNLNREVVYRLVFVSDDTILHRSVRDAGAQGGTPAQLSLRRQRALVPALHAVGLNVAHLINLWVMAYDQHVSNGTAAATADRDNFVAVFQRLLLVEIICRTIKGQFELQVLSRQLAGDEEELSKAFSKAISTILTVDRDTAGMPLSKKAFEATMKRFPLAHLDLQREEVQEQLVLHLGFIVKAERSVIVRHVSDLLRVSVSAAPDHTVVSQTSNLMASTDGQRNQLKWRPFVKHSFLEIQHAQPMTKAELTQCELTRADVGPKRMFALEYPMYVYSALMAGEADSAQLMLQRLLAHSKDRFGKDGLQHLRNRFLSLLLSLHRYQVSKEATRHPTEAGTELLRDLADAVGKQSLAQLLNVCRVAELDTRVGMDNQAAISRYRQAVAIANHLNLNPKYAAGLSLRPYEGLLRCLALSGDTETKMNSSSVERERTEELVGLKKPILNIARKSAPTNYIYFLLVDFGNQLRAANAFAAAIEVLTAALSICRSVFGEQSVVAVDVLNSIAFVYYSWDVKAHLDECIAILKETQKVCEAIYGPSTAEVAVPINNVGSLMMQAGNYREALVCFEKANSIFAKVVPRDDPNFVACRRNLAILRNRIKIKAIVSVQTWIRRFVNRTRNKRAAGQRRLEQVQSDEWMARDEIASTQVAEFSKLEASELEERSHIDNQHNMRRATSFAVRDEANAVELDEDMRRGFMRRQEKEARATLQSKYDSATLAAKDVEQRIIQLRIERTRLVEEDEPAARELLVANLEAQERAQLLDQLGRGRILVFNSERREHLSSEERVSREEIEHDEIGRFAEISVLAQRSRKNIEIFLLAQQDYLAAKEQQQQLEMKKALDRKGLEKQESDTRSALHDIHQQALDDIEGQATREKMHLIEERSKVITGKMRASYAMKAIVAVARGYLTRKSLPYLKRTHAILLIQGHLLAQLSVNAVHSAQRLQQHRCSCIGVVQAFLQARMSCCVVIAKKANIVRWCMAGFRVRKRLHRIKARRLRELVVKARSKLLEDEALGREQLHTEERNSLREIARQRAYLRDRQREHKERQRQKEAEHRSYEVKKEIVVMDEDRIRADLQDTALFSFSQLVRQHRVAITKIRKAVTAAAGATNTSPTEDSTRLVSRSAEASSQTKSVSLPVLPVTEATRLRQEKARSQEEASKRKKQEQKKLRTQRLQQKYGVVITPPHGSTSLVVASQRTHAAPSFHHQSRNMTAIQLGVYEGYPLDDIVRFAMLYEEELLLMKQRLMKQREELQVKCRAIGEMRDAAAQQILPPSESVAWVPSRPLLSQSATPEYVRNGRPLAGTSPLKGLLPSPRTKRHGARELVPYTPLVGGPQRRPNTSDKASLSIVAKPTFDLSGPTLQGSDRNRSSGSLPPLAEALINRRDAAPTGANPNTTSTASITSSFAIDWSEPAFKAHVSGLQGYLHPQQRHASTALYLQQETKERSLRRKTYQKM